jgi:hypothetical protein
MATFFQFEADFVQSLRCIPMQVRFKLDTCGVKLKLHQWNQLTQADRTTLVQMCCESAAEITAYHDWLHQLIFDRTGERATDLALDPNPAWLNDAVIPEVLAMRLQQDGMSLERSQWEMLQPLQRFALIKLSRSSHENSNFLPAMQEFGLLGRS